MDQPTITSLAVIASCAVVAPVLANLLRRTRIPAVVLELVLGIVIGQQVLGLAHVNTVVNALSQLGLSFLMFLAGYEIDLQRIKGRPIMLATIGWLISVLLAILLAGYLVATGFALNSLVFGLALTTTALGTLLPILRDEDILPTAFGTQVLSIGTLGEFGPIVAIGVLLTGKRPAIELALLLVFVAIAVAAAFMATRAQPPGVVALLQKHLDSSSQLPVRIALLLVMLLIWLASTFGLDILIGAFAAGVVIRLFTPPKDKKVISQKLEAIGFGFLIPIFFVVSGMNFDLNSLIASPTAALRVPLFALVFLVVRGVPSLLLPRRQLPFSQRIPLAFFSATALPLVVVITGIGVSSGRMRPENAAALVGAGMLSVMLYPIIGLALAGRAGVTGASTTLVVDPELH